MNMSHFGIFVLIFAIIGIHKVQSQCDPTLCDNVCQKKGMPAGNCNGNSCDCSYGKKCSAMVKLTCDLACKREGLVGVCLQNDFCFCRVRIMPCLPWKCTQQCQADPRAKECEAAGGFVTAIGCMEYGNERTCVCLCTLPGLTSDHSSSSELFRYTVTRQ